MVWEGKAEAMILEKVVEVLESETLDSNRRHGCTRYVVRTETGSIVSRVMRGPSHDSPPTRVKVTHSLSFTVCLIGDKIAFVAS